MAQRRFGVDRYRVAYSLLGHNGFGTRYVASAFAVVVIERLEDIMSTDIVRNFYRS